MQQLETDLNYISSLADQPAMATAELKAQFDMAGNTIKNYINNLFIPSIAADIATSLATAKAYADNAVAGVSTDADAITYDNTTSGLEAENVQDAIDELNTDIGGATTRITAIETALETPVIKTVEIVATITCAQGYSASATRSIPAVTGYQFIGFTSPYCQRGCSCSIKSVDGQVITIEVFNSGGGNPKVHFRCLYIPA